MSSNGTTKVMNIMSLYQSNTNSYNNVKEMFMYIIKHVINNVSLERVLVLEGLELFFY